MSVKIAIVDYGMGNIHSVYRKLAQQGIEPVIATTPQEILKADKIILPGVGSFDKAVSNLQALNLVEALNEAVLIKKVPVLGICLGMQLMAAHSEEGNVAGFGWLKASVVKFNIQDKLKFKIPQTGWNTITICKESGLLKDIPDNSEFYFLHAYHYHSTEPASVLSKTSFEYDFVSAVAQENIFGTQFHPEKSHASGARLLKNFIQI